MWEWLRRFLGPIRKVASRLLGKKAPTSVLGAADALSAGMVKAATDGPMAEIAAKFAGGLVDPAVWLEETWATLRSLYIEQYMLARGGRGVMTQRDWGIIGRQLRDQRDFLRKWIASGKLDDQTDAYMKWRLGLYAAASREAYERGKAEAARLAGYEEVKWNLNPAEHCEDCLARALQGWQPIGPNGGFPCADDGQEHFPCDGGSACLTKCKCNLKFRRGAKRKGGPGSGWFAPPKGTHGEGSQGGNLFGRAGVAVTDYRAGRKSALVAKKWMDRGLEAEECLGAGDDERGRIKAEIVRLISERSGVDHEVVNKIVAQWASTSLDRNMRAIALHQDAIAEFGLETAEQIDWLAAKLNDEMQGTIERDVTDRGGVHHAEWVRSGLTPVEFMRRQAVGGEGVLFSPWFNFYFPIADSTTQRKVLRAMYDITQERLKVDGVVDADGYITLYRGVSVRAVGKRQPIVGEIAGYKDNPLSSWSALQSVAIGFAHSHVGANGAVVVEMRVPVENIIGTARTGLGCLTEAEFVVLDGHGLAKITHFYPIREYPPVGKGGPGSGWFSPPKGTHGEGSQGGKPPEEPSSTDRWTGVPVYPLADRASEWLRQTAKVPNWERAVLERGRVKDNLVRAIAERSGIDYETVNSIIDQWSGSSFSDDVRSLSLQRDACLEFGIPVPGSVTYRLNDAKERLDSIVDMFEGPEPEDIYQVDAVGLTLHWSREEWRASGKPILQFLRERRGYARLFPVADSDTQRRVLRAMYDITQEKLAAAGYGPDDYVTLFRGISERHMGKSVNVGDRGSYIGNPMESWSVSMRIGNRFAYSHNKDGNGLGIVMDIPVSSILGTAATGFGCLGEGEFVILNPNGECRIYLKAPQSSFKGGPGSGWFAPPRGTHGEGSQGGKSPSLPLESSGEVVPRTSHGGKSPFPPLPPELRRSSGKIAPPRGLPGDERHKRLVQDVALWILDREGEMPPGTDAVLNAAEMKPGETLEDWAWSKLPYAEDSLMEASNKGALGGSFIASYVAIGMGISGAPKGGKQFELMRRKAALIVARALMDLYWRTGVRPSKVNLKARDITSFDPTLRHINLSFYDAARCGSGVRPGRQDQHSMYHFESYWQAAVTHEFGHLWHRANIAAADHLFDQLWEGKGTARGLEQYGPTSRSRDSYDEYIAECFSLYMVGRGDLLEPHTRAMFEERIKA